MATKAESFLIAQFKDDVASLERRLKEAYEQRDQARGECRMANESRNVAQEQFADLKRRVHESEMENQRLRGYIQRVQEDDTVREELLAVGDPNGEQTLVPKRKSTVFAPSYEYEQRTHGAEIFAPGNLYAGIKSQEQPKPKHWINY